MEFKNKLVVVALSAALLSTSATFAAQPTLANAPHIPQVTWMQWAKGKLPAMPVMPTLSVPSTRTVREVAATGLAVMAVATLATSTVPGEDAAALQTIAATELAVAGALACERVAAGATYAKDVVAKVAALRAATQKYFAVKIAGLLIDGRAKEARDLDQARRLEQDQAEKDAANASVRARTADEMDQAAAGQKPVIIPVVKPAGWLEPDADVTPAPAPAAAKRRARSKTPAPVGRRNPGRAARHDQ
jgi:hypothetical protein